MKLHVVFWIQKRQAPQGCLPLLFLRSVRFLKCFPELLAGASVAAHELVHATGGVHQLALTCIEGVRGVGDFQLDEGVSLAFELDGVVGLGG